MMDATQSDVAIVGGGLAGLAAAACLARAGRRPVLFERTADLGGRARTRDAEGFRLNFGGHALYRTGPGAEVLRELGVAMRGGRPSTSGGHALFGDRLYTFPAGPVSLLSTGLFKLPEKLRLARLLASLPRLESGRFDGVPLDDWINGTTSDPTARAFLRASVRLSTYTDAPRHQSAGAALAQLRLAVGDGVIYVDAGWQTLVDDLRATAERAGATIRSGVAIERVEIAPDGMTLHSGRGVDHAARDVVLAVPPRTVASLLDGASPAADSWARALQPVRASCLDLALRRLGRPARRFLLGVDEPLYASVHSAVAKLAPSGGAVIHAMRYLDPDEPTDPERDRLALEAAVDRIQPGWREHEVARQLLPGMTVVHARVDAATGGVAGRPGPALDDLPRVFVAGDWVGNSGQLADASLASGRAAARAVLDSAARARVHAA